MNDSKRESIHRLQEDIQYHHNQQQQQQQQQQQYYQDNYQQKQPKHQHQESTTGATAGIQSSSDFDVYRLLKGHDFRYSLVLSYLFINSWPSGQCLGKKWAPHEVFGGENF